MVYRHQYPLKSMVELKLEELMDLIRENARVTSELSERMNRACQRITESSREMRASRNKQKHFVAGANKP